MTTKQPKEPRAATFSAIPRPWGSLRAAVVSTALVVVCVTLFAAGSLSNWFRYGLSLEGTLVLAPLLAGALVSLLILAGATRARRQLFLGMVVFVASAITSTLAHREAFGTALPRLRANHVETSGTATLNTTLGVLRYRLDLQNPFAKSHREMLIVDGTGDTVQIELPIFAGSVGGYASALRPEDWVVMRPTHDPEVFEVKIGPYLLVDKTFHVNLKLRAITSMPDEG